ncbi:MAG: SDR family NAD(P)-dependent oxidoreductase [Dysosmobacter sp.]
MRSVALVTGASRGIGRAIARELAGEGYAVCVNYCQHRQEAEDLAEELRRGARTPSPCRQTWPAGAPWRPWYAPWSGSWAP